MKYGSTPHTPLPAKARGFAGSVDSGDSKHQGAPQGGLAWPARAGKKLIPGTSMENHALNSRSYGLEG